MRRILPWLVILAAPAGMFYPLWANPVSAGEDDVVYYYPMRVMTGAALREGRLPLENPLESTGGALWGDSQAAVLFPATWLFAVADAKVAYAVSIYLAFVVAGAGAYLYLRRLGLVAAASTFGAVAFMFCGFLVGHRVHLSMLQTAAFLPWALWCIELLRARPWAGFAWMVPVGFLTIAGGHWAILIYMAMLWAAYFLARARPMRRSLVVAAAAGMLAAMLAAPQLAATGELMAQATRKGIGLSEAGENSFFPTAAVLALYPMLMGVRQAGFFPDKWWGPWHHCEMLGYVGLSTLVLAGAAVWRLYRRGDLKKQKEHTDCNPCALGGANPFSGLVKLWTWVAVLSGLWMLGYYLPSYRLIHMVPVLGMARCPARMVLVVDMALASLAAIGVHVAATGEGVGGRRPDRLRKTIRRGAGLALPAAMLATLGALALGARLLADRWGALGGAFYAGTAADAVAAIRLSSPAVWVPLTVVLATILAMRLWLRRPRRRGAILAALLLADLFFLTRFIDVPPRGAATVDPDVSPAGQWLKAHDGPTDAQGRPLYRIWSLAGSYHERPAELLLPMTGQALGFATLGTYGPWHAPAHAHLLGFDHYGRCRPWEWLLRRNDLLSLYRVRYVLAADAEFRRVIESVRVPERPPAPDGANLLVGPWELREAMRQDDGSLQLGSPIWWHLAYARQAVPLKAGAVYRVEMEVQAPGGTMANLLRVELWPQNGAGPLLPQPCLEVATEQVSGQWRKFQRTFQVPASAPESACLVISIVSERYIRVRNVEFRRSDWPQPVVLAGELSPGESVYRKVCEVEALRPGEAPVAVYENRLALRGLPSPLPRRSPEEVEALKWADAEQAGAAMGPPSLSVTVTQRPRWLLLGTGSGGLLYLWVLAARGRWRRRVRDRTRA